MSVFIEDIDNFLQNPGSHASNPRFEEMKETLVFLKEHAVGINNLIATDKVIEHLNSKGYDIGKEAWQISVKGYLWENGIFIGSVIPKGIFLIDSEQDIRETITSMKSRVEKENERIRKLKDKAENIGVNLE
jgi:hypothetical protein